jgi:hypothetical protein
LTRVTNHYGIALILLLTFCRFQKQYKIFSFDQNLLPKSANEKGQFQAKTLFVLELAKCVQQYYDHSVVICVASQKLSVKNQTEGLGVKISFLGTILNN